jgi:hypothetical protein
VFVSCRYYLSNYVAPIMGFALQDTSCLHGYAATAVILYYSADLYLRIVLISISLHRPSKVHRVLDKVFFLIHSLSCRSYLPNRSSYSSVPTATITQQYTRVNRRSASAPPANLITNVFSPIIFPADVAKGMIWPYALI